MIDWCEIHGFVKFYKYKSNLKGRCSKCHLIRTSKRRQQIKVRAVEYLGGKCSKCGYNSCMAALEFHHIDPEKKDFGICGYSRSWEHLKEELDKCIILCSNCHKELEYNELKGKA